jgi:hypothetical protein
LTCSMKLGCAVTATVFAIAILLSLRSPAGTTEPLYF